MKKLIFAAFAAVLGLASFADCEINDAGYCAYAYRIKLVGKTVKGKALDASSPCETGSCWAKKASLRITGYIYNTGADQSDATCECECPCDGHWDLADNKCFFWDENKDQVLADVESMEIDVYDVLRNSGSKDKAQLGFKIGDLYLAGFGVFNPASGRLKRAHGFFAGTLPKPVCTSQDSSTCEITEDTAMVFRPCDTVTEVEADKAIAYGHWKMAWKSEKVAMLNAGKDPLEEGVCVPYGCTKCGD